ncbi:MAG: hypothetical protein ACI8VC_001654 [Candidatus Endobugula sp.]|jgi:hypothetical protein
MHQNHLLEPISCLLSTQAAPMSEYTLIQQLQGQGWLDPINLADTLSLYSTHFIVYNALYQLQPRYRDQQQHLRISALDIGLQDVSTGLSAGTMPAYSLAHGYHEENEALRDFYLNWDNVDTATQQSVDTLLNGFWKRYVEDDELTMAFVHLELDMRAPYIDCKQKYRQLAMQHHPDRGGEERRFKEVQHAFSVVQRHYCVR